MSTGSMTTPRGVKNGRLVLNVGGKRFETLLETLRKYPNTMLGAMFSSSVALAVPDETGEVPIAQQFSSAHYYAHQRGTEML